MSTPRKIELSAIQLAKLEAFLPALTRVLSRHYRPDCCVAAARITCDVFERLHIPCQPLAVEVLLFNRAMLERAEQIGRLPASQAECNRWAIESGAWGVELGLRAGIDPNDPGHVVAVAWGMCMIDATLPQAARPEHGILPRPMAAVVSPEFLRGDRVFWDAEDWGKVCYTAIPAGRHFTKSRDWQDRKRVEPIVRDLVRTVRSAIRDRDDAA
jgi:hypothetical protein